MRGPLRSLSLWKRSGAIPRCSDSGKRPLTRPNSGFPSCRGPLSPRAGRGKPCALTPRMCAYRVHVRTTAQPHSHGVPHVKAILCTRLGGPDDLELAELPMPVAAAGEAVVSIKAVGLNFYDTLIIAGKYQTKPPLPFSPGGEFAGVIESVGAGVTGFAPGDRVMGYTSFGAARQFAAVPVEKLARLSVDLDLDARRRPQHHLRHQLSRAARPRRPQGRRDPGGARRLRRRRARGRGARQADGGARHRLRVERRQARLRARCTAPTRWSTTPARI